MLIPDLNQYITSLDGAEYKGFVIPLFALAAMISRPFSGKLADTIGRIPVMIVGVLVCFVIGFVYPLWQTLMGFLFLRFMHGFSAGFKPTGTVAYLADIVPVNKRGEAMGMIGMFGTLGMSIGLSVGPRITSSYGIETLFRASSLVSILSIILIIGMKESLANKQPIRLSHFSVGVKDFMEPKVFAPSIVMILTIISLGAILTIIPDLSDHLGLPPENRGLFFSVFTIASIVVRFAAGKASDKYGRANILKISTFMIALAMFMMGWVTSVNELIVVAVIFGLAVGINSPTIFAWTVDLADSRYRGRATATMFIALELGVIIGGVLSGFLYRNDPSNFVITLSGCGSFAFLAFLYLLFIHPKYVQK